MSNLSGRDIYDKDHLLISLDKITPELLYQLAEVRKRDYKLEELQEAMEFAMRFLTSDELELLFFRFLHGNSYKTLKITVNLGSTKTAAKRIKKLSEAIKEYIFYNLEQDYDIDMKFIEEALGKDAKGIAELLFKRMSKHAILRCKIVRISQKRLNRVIDEIEMLCLRNLRLSGFWELLNNVGKFPSKKV